jgi:hypothetical protein
VPNPVRGGLVTQGGRVLKITPPESYTYNGVAHVTHPNTIPTRAQTAPKINSRIQVPSFEELVEVG